jgi:hypothetical protein
MRYVLRRNERTGEMLMMKTLLVATALTAAVVVATPASAQFYAGAGPGGVGVEVGPFGAGVGPRYDWRDRPYTDGYYAASADCRTVRERIETPSGRVIFKTRRICD